MIRGAFCLLAMLSSSISAQDDPWVVYPGGDGGGAGKHIVLIAGDEEYRSEEAMPMLGRVLSVHHGFKCTVLFSTNPETGEIRRFLVGPRECEVTGTAWSADRKTLFVGIQHPGERGGSSHFPGGGDTVPRSSIVAITRDDGGEIG